jgi:membrane protease YdiL (CAAX protease family)
VSVGIRLLCHLYQGPLAVGIVPVGLVFTWYYARTHRLWPVVIAHAISDFVALVAYT